MKKEIKKDNRSHKTTVKLELNILGFKIIFMFIKQ